MPTPSSTNLPIVLVLLSMLVASASSSFILDTPKIQNLRVLQSEPQNYGSYQINANFSETCKDYSPGELVYTEAELNATVHGINNNFEFAYEPFEKFLKTNDTTHLNEMFEQATCKVIFFIIVAIILLFIIPCIIGYFCCNCRCICCDGDVPIDDSEYDSDKIKGEKQQRRQRRAERDERFTSPGCRKFIKYTTYIVAIAVVVATIGTVITMFKSTQALKKTDCAISHTFNDLLRGRKDEY